MPLLLRGPRECGRLPWRRPDQRGRVDEFLRSHVLHSRRADRICRYGFGLEFVANLDDRPLYFQKDGVNVGTSGVLRHYPDPDLTVALLSNTRRGVREPMRRLHALIVDRG